MAANGNGSNQGGGSSIGIIFVVVFILICFGSCSQGNDYSDPFDSGYHYYLNE